MTEDPALPPGPLTGVFQFDVGGIYVRGDQLGGRLETNQDDRRVWVDLPGSNQAELGEPGISGWRGNPADPGAIFRVERVEVGVALGNVDRGADPHDLLRSVESVASKVLRRLLNWARIFDRQPWLPPPHIQISPAGPSWIANDAGDRSRGYGTESTVFVMFSDENAPSGDLSEALGDRNFDESASLLAEARWAVWPSGDGDYKRAVLMAAIALEIKASEVLLAMADERVEPLLKLLLDDEPSVNRMLNKIAPAVGGESLKEYDGQLSKAVTDLVTLRNDVAHRGKTPEGKDALRAVKTAEEVFLWLGTRLRTAGT